MVCRTELIQQWLWPAGSQPPWLSTTCTSSVTTVPDHYQSTCVWVRKVSAKYDCITVSILVISSNVGGVCVSAAGIKAAVVDCRTVRWLHSASVVAKASHTSVR